MLGVYFMKDRIFWGLLFLIGVSWIANNIYAHSKKLDEPIFLDHYVDTTLQEDVYLPLYYLANLHDTTTISYVTIHGIPNYVIQDNFYSNFGSNYDAEHNQNLQIFTHHALRNIQLQLNTFELENLLQDGQFTFNEIEVFFSDGKNMTVPIGEITVHADHSNYDSDVLNFISGSSSSDGSSKSTFRVTERLSIENIMFKYDDLLRDKLLIKINSQNQLTSDDISNTTHTQGWTDVPGIDLQNIHLPYELEKDEMLYIHTQILPELTYYINSMIIFSGTTKTGETFTFSNWLINEQPYLSQKDVNKLIKK